MMLSIKKMYLCRMIFQEKTEDVLILAKYQKHK